MKVKLLNKKEAAEALGVSVHTLSYWVQNQTAPPSARIGKRRVWREEDLEAWVTAKFEDAK